MLGNKAIVSEIDLLIMQGSSRIKRCTILFLVEDFMILPSEVHNKLAYNKVLLVNYKTLCRNFLTTPCRIKAENDRLTREEMISVSSISVSLMSPMTSMPLLLL